MSARRRVPRCDTAVLVRLSDAEAWALDKRAHRDRLSRPEILRRALQRELSDDADDADEPRKPAAEHGR